MINTRLSKPNAGADAECHGSTEEKGLRWKQLGDAMPCDVKGFFWTLDFDPSKRNEYCELRTGAYTMWDVCGDTSRSEAGRRGCWDIS